WSMVSGKTFFAWLELVVAARTDRHLRRAVVAFVSRFDEAVRQSFRQLFPDLARTGPNPFFELAPPLTFAFMHGLALDHIVSKDDTRLNVMLDLWKRLAPLALSQGGNDAAK